MTGRVRRVLTAVAAVVILVVLAGATYQGVATALERREFPHPGRLVDVGGHQLHILCTGSGSPTVVFEASAAGMSSAWASVQSAVADVTRACSYDRAGLGWSEAGDGPYDPGAVPQELRALLANASEPPPYVIVGQGLGAAFATSLAADLGPDTAALVLIDAPDAEHAAAPVSIVRLINASPWLARTGILRATRTLSTAADGLPQAAAGSLKAFLNRPDHLTRAAHELRRWDDTLRAAADASRRDTREALRLTVAPGGRMAFLTDPRDTARVSAAVIDIVEQVRQTERVE